MKTMQGAILPGNSTVELKEFPVPSPGYGQVLIQMKASTICGSDIRAIYREHLGKGPEKYQGVIAGHEPCGLIVEVGEGCKLYKIGDRVIMYHISGCGVCRDCRMGYMVGCSSPLRSSYGWQRDGGHADFILADESTLIHLPDELSYLDGAMVACGFGTSYEALTRISVSGKDVVLVVGLGPVGLSTLMLAKAFGAIKTIGVDTVDERIELAKSLGIVDVAFKADSEALKNIMSATNGNGAEASVDCSGSPAGRLLAIQGTRQWGRVAMVGEGNSVTFEPSRDIIHKQIAIYGSWVTSLPNMEILVEKLVAWKMHPSIIVSHKYSLSQVSEAYKTMDEGKCGKVAIVWE